QMGSTAPLWSSVSGGYWARSPDSFGPISPVSQPQGRCRCQLRPCERKSGVKVANSNQRTYSSLVYSFLGARKKPPTSEPQNGETLSEKLRPTGMWLASVAQRDCTSPDQTHAP